MLTRIQVMQSATIAEATHLAKKLAKELELYSDADCMVPKTLIQELMPDRGWNDKIRDDSTGENFRRRVAEKLVVSWKHRKSVEIAQEVSQEADEMVRAKLKRAGVTCATMESVSKGVWRTISQPNRKRIF